MKIKKSVYQKKIFLFISIFLMASFCHACSKKIPNKSDIMNQLEEKPVNQSNPFIIIETNHGDIIAELYNDAAPNTISNIVGLAEGTKEFTDPANGTKVKRPYYDKVIFHRIIPNFMIQGGDILGNGTGGPGYKFEDEINADDLGLGNKKLSESQSYMQQSHIQMVLFKRLNITSQETLDQKRHLLEAEYKKILDLTIKEFLTEVGYHYNDQLKSYSNEKYTLSMANAGPNTNGSQFFINITDNTYLDGKHTVFGKVLKGRDVVEKIEKVKTDPSNNKPLEDVTILRIRKLSENEK